MFAVVSQITKRRQTFHNSCRTGAASSGRIRNNSVQIWRAVRYEVKRFCTELKFPPPPPLKICIIIQIFVFQNGPCAPPGVRRLRRGSLAGDSVTTRYEHPGMLIVSWIMLHCRFYFFASKLIICHTMNK